MPQDDVTIVTPAGRQIRLTRDAARNLEETGHAQAAPVTPETLTVEMINKLHGEAYRAEDREVEYLCSDAKRKGVARIAKEREAAKIKICEILNRADRADG